jgi:hypothetical protein
MHSDRECAPLWGTNLCATLCEETELHKCTNSCDLRIFGCQGSDGISRSESNAGWARLMGGFGENTLEEHGRLPVIGPSELAPRIRHTLSTFTVNPTSDSLCALA